MKGQIILITGASSGIGRETAYRLAKAEAKLILTYNRGKARGEAALKQCRKLGAADTLLLQLDVMDNDAIAEAAREVKKKFGAIDFLLNNAGVGVFIPFGKQTLKDIERQIKTNFEGLIKVTRAFLPTVKKGIVNIASAAGQEAYANMSVYCGTKFGVRGFTQTIALEYPRLKICCVNPDETATRLSGFQGRPPAEVAEVIFRVVSGQVPCSGGNDVNVWEVI
ncbi:MAG: SDR family oxidoreductase [Deltaproteobacteria bacterium]|nr:SDR family oxidoreductase [Deltaproteobacteria bacterium]